jgi:hypothetical protein
MLTSIDASNAANAKRIKAIQETIKIYEGEFDHFANSSN